MDCWCSSEPVLVRDNPFQVLTEISPFRYCQRGAGSQRRQRKRGKRKRAVHRSRTTCRRHPLPPGLRFLELSCVGAEETFVRLCQHLLRQKKKAKRAARDVLQCGTGSFFEAGFDRWHDKTGGRWDWRTLFRGERSSTSSADKTAGDTMEESSSLTEHSENLNKAETNKRGWFGKQI
jgi:hypothetical protein